MNNTELSRAITEAADERDGKKRLSCFKAFAISEKLSVSVKEIGEFCNENNIKISSCQLGCFK